MSTPVAPGVTLLSRQEIGWPATVYQSDGRTPRPHLAAPARWITVHYTGATVDYSDKGDFIAECQALERYAVSANKSNEYNWIIGADGPDAAAIATYAGDYQAAHSSGENAQAIGVLFMNGVGQRVTDSQVTAFQWLVADLDSRGRTSPTSTAILPHLDMPDAATACPGDMVLARWTELITPYSPGEDDDDMVDYDEIELRVNKALNRGTAQGTLDWAETCRTTLGVTQSNYNEIKRAQRIAGVAAVGAIILAAYALGRRG